MATYNLVCELGHAPETMSVEAESEEDALVKMKVVAIKHNAQNHPALGMSEDDLEAFIKEHWTQGSAIPTF